MQKDKKEKVSQNVRSNYESIEAFKKHVNKIALKKCTQQTIYNDKLLLTARTYNELLRLNKNWNKKHNSNNFLTISYIKAHIAYRVKTNNFVYEYSKDDKDNDLVKHVSISK